MDYKQTLPQFDHVYWFDEEINDSGEYLPDDGYKYITKKVESDMKGFNILEPSIGFSMDGAYVVGLRAPYIDDSIEKITIGNPRFMYKVEYAHPYVPNELTIGEIIGNLVAQDLDLPQFIDSPNWEDWAYIIENNMELLEDLPIEFEMTNEYAEKIVNKWLPEIKSTWADYEKQISEDLKNFESDEMYIGVVDYYDEYVAEHF